MNSDSKLILVWHGAAHYHIYYRNLAVIIDPLYTRLPGDKPHLEATKYDVERLDYLLLTHGHLDHSADFAFLAAKHNPETYAPEECLRDIRRIDTGSALEFDKSKCHALEDIKGKAFRIADLEVTPYQIGTEEIDFWFIREMFIRPWLHGRPQAIPAGLKWLATHLYCNGFAFLFKFPPAGKTMLYFGNLTEQVDELSGVSRANILAIPYCPANNKWIEQSQFLINRFKPEVTLVHHFDNFMNPYTLSKYMDLDKYRAAVLEKCPGAKFYFSRFHREVELSEILKC
ncbi:MBL fold metallo-hydrolase [Candidatus Poribacteria bacterium]|nr:MBL fold metallo-hydrolase [Candidatus Poribacteria bacterium]